MRKFLWCSALAVSVAGLATTAPASAQEQAPWWSGGYLGAKVGVSWGNASLNRTITPGTGPNAITAADVGVIGTGSRSNNGTGITGGIEAGYDYNMNGWLLGLETDFVGIDTGKRRTSTYASLVNPGVGYTVGSEAAVDWMWTLRPRLGYTAGPWLLFITGGLAVGNVNMSATVSDNRTPQNLVHASRSEAEVGWTAGAGIGYAFSDALSMKVEYLYSDLGSMRVRASRDFATLTAVAKTRPEAAFIGLDYHFGQPAYVAPAPAPYVPPPAAAPSAPSKYMVFFDFNRSELTSEARTIVDQAAANAGPARVTSITVTGHTDTVGSDAYNMRLSRRRAESVATELEAKGIPSNEITLVAKGKRDLLVPTADGVREPQNRRVEIVYGGGPAS